VTDDVVLASPQSFGTALVTLGQWQVLGPGSLAIHQGDQAVHVDIASTGSGFEIKAEQIREEVTTPSLPTRLGINLTQPVAKATVTVRIR